MTTLLRSTVLAVVLAGSAIATAAENVPEPVLTGIPHQALFSIAMDGERGIAVGAGGEIQVTEDGGATWTRETTPSPLSLLGARSGVLGAFGVVVSMVTTRVVEAALVLPAMSVAAAVRE